MKTAWTNDEQNMGCVIVDDDPAVCSSFEFDFKHTLGMRRLNSFTDPQEALDYFKQHHTEVDVVLLDLNMPEIDGVEMLVRINELDSAIQVLVVSAYADQDAVKETLCSLGFPSSRIITKPVKIELLSEILREAYHEARQLRAGNVS